MTTAPRVRPKRARSDHPVGGVGGASPPAPPLQAALDRLAARLQAAWNARDLTLWLYEPESQTLVYAANGAGDPPPEQPVIATRPAKSAYYRALALRTPVAVSPAPGGADRGDGQDDLAVPLLCRGRTVGLAVATCNVADGGPAASRLRRMQAEANRAVGVLPAPLLEAAAHRALEHATLYRLDAVIQSQAGAVAILHQVAAIVLEALQPEIVSIWSYHREDDTFEELATAGAPAQLVDGRPVRVPSAGVAHYYRGHPGPHCFTEPPGDSPMAQRAADIFRRFPVREMVTTPLLLGGECLGLLHLAYRRPGGLTPERAALLQRVVGRVAQLFVARGLHRAEDLLARELDAVARIAQAVMSGRPTPAVLDEVVRAAREALEAVRVALAVWEPAGAALRVASYAGAPVPGMDGAGVEVRVAGTTSGEVLATGRSRVVDRETLRRIAQPVALRVVQALDPAAVLLTPILHQARPVGMLYACFSQSSFASATAVALAERIARYVAPVLANTIGEARAQQHELERVALEGISEAIGGEVTGAGLLAGVARVVQRVLGADRVLVWIWDRHSGQPRLAALTGDAPPERWERFNAAAEQGPRLGPGGPRVRVLTGPDLVQHSPLGRLLAEELGLARTVSSPLRRGDQLLGVLMLGYAGADGPLDPATVAFIDTISGYVAAAVAAARTRDELQEQARVHEALHRISEAMVSGQSVGQVLTEIAEAAQVALAADRLTVWRYRPESSCFEAGASAGIGNGARPFERLPAAGTGALAALEERRPQVLRRSEGWRQPTADGAAVLDGMSLDALVVWPVVHHGQPLGVLSAGYRDHRAITPARLTVGEMLANHAAAAIHSADLHQRTLERARALEALSDVARTVATAAGRPTFLHELAAAARQALGAGLVAVWQQTPGTGALALRGVALGSAIDPGARALLEALLVPDGLAAGPWVRLYTREADAAAETPWRRLLESAGLACLWVAPVAHGERALGLVAAGFLQPPASTGVPDTLQHIAGQVAYGLLGMQLHEQTEMHGRELQALQAISAAATSSARPQEIFDAVCAAAQAAVQAVRAALWVYDPTTDGVHLVSTTLPLDGARPEESPWLPVQGSLLGRTLTSGAPQLLTRDTQASTQRHLPHLFDVSGVQTVLLLPIGSQSEPLGVLSLAFTRMVRLQDAEAQVAAAIASHAAVAISHANHIEDDRITAERLQIVSENSSEVTYAARILPDGSIELEWVSRGVEALSGYDMAALERLGGWAALVHPDDRASFGERHERLLAGHLDVRDYRIVTASGAVRVVHDRARPVWSTVEQRFVRIFGAARDVTEERRTRQALEALEQVAPATLDALSAKIAILDQAGAVMAVNLAWRNAVGLDGAVGLTPPLAIGANYLAVCQSVTGELGAAAQRLCRGIEAVAAGREERFDLEYRVPGAEDRWLVARVTCLDRAAGSVVVAHEDITDRKRAEEALVRQAMYDPLTGLPNRAMLFERLQRALAEATQLGNRPALLIMDLDRFKEVNDSFGHETGDVLLGLVAERLTSALQGRYLVARLGGDEFAVLVPGEPAAEPAEAVAETVVQALRPPFLVDGLAFDVQASVGVAQYPDHGMDVQTLLRRADVAMYVAKRSGTGVALYAREQDRNQPRRLTLLAELRRAIDEDQLVLEYHPQVELRTGAVQWVEALVRWRHPTLGMLQPDAFVPLAEQSGLIYQLTRWILRRSLRQAAAWRRQGVHLGVAVNVSARDLQLPSLPAFVVACLRRYRVPASRLKIEITESSLIGEQDQVVQALAQLRARGVRVVLDDFGMGYASLTHLKRLPVDELKIDRSFVGDLRVSGLDHSIVRLTIELGHQMGATVVAEGVEDAETHRVLTELGCDAAQGFYLAEPAPPERLRRWMLQRPAG